MDKAFQAFQADLAGVGSTGQMGPPPGHQDRYQTMYLPPPGSYGVPGYHHGPPPPSAPFYGSAAMGHEPPPYQGPPSTAPYSRGPGGPPPSAAHHQHPGGQTASAGPSGSNKQPKGQVPPPHGDKKKGVLREAAGSRWRDATLDEWPDNDFRIFVGNLGNDVNDDSLVKAFQKYPSFTKAKIVKDKATKKNKGFGFVSFLTSEDFGKALKEMQGKYVGNRPIKLRKSTAEERNAHLPPRKPQVAGPLKKSQAKEAHAQVSR